MCELSLSNDLSDDYDSELITCNENDGYTEVKGLVTNNSHQTQAYTILFSLIDESGRVVDFKNSHALDVPPGVSRGVDARFYDYPFFDSCRMSVESR